MNIWNWIEKLQQDLQNAGQGHSAQLIDTLSDEVCEQEIERAAALLPEAKALCRTLENPWLEVYVGHWEMRNRIGNNSEGESALADAVALFELAHRDNTHECPQSVCVTQDLAACYANIDGPGWALERIEVCDDTLARISPKWACFQCISIEKSEALLDMGKAQEALDYLDAQRALLDAAHFEENGGMVEFRNRLLIELGRHDEALQSILQEEAKCAGAPEWNNIKQPRDLQKATIFSALQRDDDALAALPALSEINTSKLHRWLAAIYPVLLRRPQLNNWALASRLQKGLAHLQHHGAHRFAIEMAVRLFHLALARGARWSAEQHLKCAQSILPKLKTDAGASALLDDLAKQLAQHPPTPLPVCAEQLLYWLENQPADTERDPEREVQWLLAALAEVPDDINLRMQAVEALRVIAQPEQAIALLWESVRDNTDVEFDPAYTLLGMLLDVRRHAEVEQLANLYQASTPTFTHWAHAALARAHEDWQSVESHCKALIALLPAHEWHNAYGLHAHSLMQQQRFADATAAYQQIIDLLPNEKDPCWDYMTAAAAAENWAAVRKMAAAMELDLPEAEGEFDSDYGWVIIRFIEDGDALDYYARRTGPVTARILENAPPRARQHVDDAVVFAANLLVPPPEDAQQRKYFIPTYKAVHVYKSGGYGRSYVIDGPSPGDEKLQALRERLGEKSIHSWIHTGDGFMLQDTQTNAPTHGFIMTVSAKQNVSAAELNRLLDAACSDWDTPPCWTQLAEEAGADTRRHVALSERYQR